MSAPKDRKLDVHELYGALFDLEGALMGLADEIDRAAGLDQPVTRETLEQWARLMHLAKACVDDCLCMLEAPEDAGAT